MDELTKEELIKMAEFCIKRDHKLIDSLTEEQAKDALKYLCDRTHNKDGSPVLLVFDHDMVNFNLGEDRHLGGFDCFSHTFADALETVGVDLEKEIII